LSPPNSSWTNCQGIAGTWATRIPLIFPIAYPEKGRGEKKRRRDCCVVGTMSAKNASVQSVTVDAFRFLSQLHHSHPLNTLRKKGGGERGGKEGGKGLKPATIEARNKFAVIQAGFQNEARSATNLCSSFLSKIKKERKGRKKKRGNKTHILSGRNACFMAPTERCRPTSLLIFRAEERKGRKRGKTKVSAPARISNHHSRGNRKRGTACRKFD